MFKTEDEVRERARAYAGGAIASPNEATRELWAAIHTLAGGEDLIGDGTTDEGRRPVGSTAIAPRRGDRTIEQREPVTDQPPADPAGRAAIARVQEREAQGRENVGDQDAVQRDREAADRERQRRQDELDQRERDLDAREQRARDREANRETTGAERAGTERA